MQSKVKCIGAVVVTVPRLSEVKALAEAFFGDGWASPLSRTR